ncbi:MAG TPA: hypothetical protein VN688_07385 [Gemmataceae bacterium]|nr:hypothetical protein [Gemmataceae bacterium]
MPARSASKGLPLLALRVGKTPLLALRAGKAEDCAVDNPVRGVVIFKQARY